MTDRRFRVGLLATHPVQYYAPWYRRLGQAVDLEVFYAHRQSAEGQGEAGFGVAFDWDVPLLEGYAARFLHNRARRPDVSAFFGCDTPEIAAIVRRGRFDAFIVHGWAMRSYWQAITACWRSRTPVLVRGDSQLETSRSRAWRLAKRALYRCFVPRFDAYLVVGERARAYLVHYGADPGRMFFAPHAVDNEFFAARVTTARARREELRAGWGIPPGAVVALFCGKLLDRKRPEDFLLAVASAAGAGADLWGLVAGDGPLRTRLEATARHEGWPVRFTGFLNQTELPGAHAAADVLVLPSDGSETWGLVVNEAMASGLPAIVSDRVGCGPDLVRSGETGETFPCGDVGRLAGILRELAADRTRLARLGAGARRHVARYSVDAAVRGTVEAIERLVVGPAYGVARPARRAARALGAPWTR